MDSQQILKELEVLKDAAEKQYRLIDKVYCPYLGRDVRLNSKGLDHIKFKEWKRHDWFQINICV